MTRWNVTFTLVLACLFSPHLQAQTTPKAAMTLDEAIQIGLAKNYVLRVMGYSVNEVNAQIEEAYTGLWPKVNFSSNYTRNLVSSNPFAGSSAGSLFSSFGSIGWLAYNESARTDADPATNPITLNEYFGRVAAGQAAAGVESSSSSNPFAVANNITNAVAINQTLYNAAVVQGLKAADAAKTLNTATLLRQQQQVVSQIRGAFYRVMLAREQVRVISNSMARLNETVKDVGKTVAQGVAPRFQRLSAEVELSNLETQKITAENNAELALSSLKMLIGLPMEEAIDIRGTWKDYQNANAELDKLSLEDAVTTALKNRPDLIQAQQNIELQKVQKGLTLAQGKPIVSAFSNLAFLGRIPSNRTYAEQDAQNPFKFTKKHNSIFNDSYWDPNVTIGIQLSWSLYDGGTRRYQLQRNQIAIDRAELQKLQLTEGIKLEVEQALRSLASAKQRIKSQEQNIERAEENYRITSTRLQEGLGTQLEERNASELLDQSRLAYIAAVFDYLNAKNNAETALGKLPFVNTEVLNQPNTFKTGGIWNWVNKMYGLK